MPEMRRDLQTGQAAGTADHGHHGGDSHDVPQVRGNGDREVTKAQFPTVYETLLWERSKKLFEQSIPTLNEMLGRLVTLNTALIGGGLVLAKGDNVPLPFAVPALFLFLFSLAYALWGLWPRTQSMKITNLAVIESFSNDLVSKKSTAQLMSGITMFLGLFFSVVGAVLNSQTSK